MKTRQQKSQLHKRILDYTLSYMDEVRHAMDSLDPIAIEKIINILLNAYKNNRTIYILGNGGSASIASHIACDLGKGTLQRMYDKNEKRLNVISLTDNIALITAYANDLSYDSIYSQQLRNLLKKDDVVIAISGSGNSRNVLRAIIYAKKIGATTIGFTGFSGGGKLAKISDVTLIVKSGHYGPVEDIHQMVGHLLTSFIASFKNGELPNNNKRKNKAVPYIK